MASSTKNYYIGSGICMLKLYGAKGYFDLGNATDFKATVKTETVDHYSTRSKQKKLDYQAIKSQNIDISLTVDALKVKTLGLAVLGEQSAFTQTSGTATDQIVEVDELDSFFDLGKRSVSAVVVEDALDATTYVNGVDYEVLTDAGMLKALVGGAIEEGATLHVSYSYAAVEDRTKILAALTTGVKGHLKFVSDPSDGRKIDLDAEVNLQPSGDLSLIGDSFGSITFSGSTVGQSTGELATLLVELD